MRNKQTKPKRSSAKSEIQRLESKLRKTKLNTPFRDTGGIIGKRVGNLFGVDGSSIGKWLGSGIGSIFGSGDYTISGQTPNYNVLTSSSQVPKFSSGKQNNIVCHREYLGDIYGTSAFTAASYPLNPGMNETFPWLSTVAQNYQEYRFHGLVFEFRPLITDFIASGSPGVVVMATNYNADAPAYVTKQQMENSEFATSVKPTTGLMHAVECDVTQTILPQRYVRTSPATVGQDLRVYDHGNFQFATQANPTVDLGELWVTYCVEFFKPILPSTVGGEVESQHSYRTGSASGTPMGSVTVANVGTMNLSFTTSTVSFPSTPLQKYLVSFNWFGTAVVAGDPIVNATGATLLSYIRGGTDTLCKQPATGTSTTTMMLSCVVQCNLSTNGNIVLTIPPGQACNSSMEVWITELDSRITL